MHNLTPPHLAFVFILLFRLLHAEKCPHKVGTSTSPPSQNLELLHSKLQPCARAHAVVPPEYKSHQRTALELCCPQYLCPLHRALHPRTFRPSITKRRFFAASSVLTLCASFKNWSVQEVYVGICHSHIMNCCFLCAERMQGKP